MKSDGKPGTTGSDEKNGNSPSHNSHHSHPTALLPPRGDYRTLLSYQKAVVISQITCRFCRRFLARGDGTIDQMGFCSSYNLNHHICHISHQ